jgi:dolichol-phosphate mannosyltransferase
MAPGIRIAEPDSGTDITQRWGSGYRADSVVVVSVHNEGALLKRLVPMVLSRGPFNLLVVNDGSTDDTGGIADELARIFTGRIEVLHLARRMGTAAACVAGFSRALERDYTRIFGMDVDCSHDPKALPLLRSVLDRADVALGSRYVPGGGTQDWPWWRLTLSRSAALYAKFVLRLPYRDLLSGFRGFRRQVLESLDLSALRCGVYAFQLELAHRCHRMGARIQEVPVTFLDRQRKRLGLRPVLEALTVVWRLRLTNRRRPLRHPKQGGKLLRFRRRRNVWQELDRAERLRGGRSPQAGLPPVGFVEELNDVDDAGRAA